MSVTGNHDSYFRLGQHMHVPLTGLAALALLRNVSVHKKQKNSRSLNVEIRALQRALPLHHHVRTNRLCGHELGMQRPLM